MYGFRIQNAENLVIRGSSTTGGYVGLSAHNVTDVTVEDSSFNNAENAGVQLEQTDAVLRGVTVSDNEKGILASKSTVSVTETTISGNDYGINLMFNSHVTLDGIDFTNNGENIHDETGDSTVNR
jgi:nitrous oxidase accessory protein NosD